MCRHADATSTPNIFAVSLLFGGAGGALIAASFGLDGGAGFLLGATLVFLSLSAFVLKRQQAADREQKPPPGEAEQNASHAAASARRARA